MSGEFQGGVCGGSSCWINPSTSLFRSSPCASAVNGPGSFGWLRSESDDSAASDGSGYTDSWNPNLMHGDNIGKSNQNDSDVDQALQQANSGINSSTNIDNSYGQNSFHHHFNSSSYGYNNNSSLFQTLFDNDSNTNQSTNYLSCPDYLINPDGFCPSLNKLDSNQFTNATTANFLPSTQPQSVLHSKPTANGLHTKKNNQESKKVDNEPSFKRPRTETPSPLPTFKVRKEKMGDRITALQQLVSPFGKTDTASVLHEAIGYIKFLHDQVGVLTTPYLKNGSTHHQHGADEMEDVKGETQFDLKSLGLCLVPISSTFPVAAETATDFWTPNFGGCFR